MVSTYRKGHECAKKSASDAEKWREIKRSTISSFSLSEGKGGMPLLDRNDHREGYMCLLISENKTLSVFLQLLA